MSDLQPTTEVRRQWFEGECESYWLFVQMEERDDEITRLQADNEALRVALEDMVNQVERDTAMGLCSVTSGCMEAALDALERQSVEGGECSRCNGSGVIPAADKRIGTWGCKDCGGTGSA